MSKSSGLIRSLFIILGMFCILEVPIVFAQGILEEITVTARKRGEDIQDVPVSMSAFSADDIESIGVSNMRDYTKLIPNVFLVETQASGFTFVNIRGVTQMRNLDPSVAILVDGVLSTSPLSMSQELFDIEQIEVLKGPQGALYGRNSMGGAINITTKRPTDEVEGFVRVGAGNGDSYKVAGSLSGPLIENKLLGRAAISYSDSDGVRDNVTLGIPSDPAENFSFRGRLIWEASEDFEADLRFSVSRDDAAALQFTETAPVFGPVAPGAPISLGCAAGIFAAASFPCISGPVTIGSLDPVPNPTNPNTGIFQGDINSTDVPIQASINGISDRDLYNVSLLAKWDMGLGTLTSVTSYDKATEANRGGQPPRTVTTEFLNSQWRDTETWSQEIRLTSPDDQRLRWIVGGYFLATDLFLSTTIQRNSLGIDTMDTFIKTDPEPRRCNFAAGFPFPGSAADTPDDCVVSFDGDSQDNTAYALFAQINYDVTDDIELSFSARYDWDEREQTIATPDIFLAFFCDQNNDGDCTDTVDLQFGDVRKVDYEAFQPKATIRWSPRENLMAFLTYSVGFRSGGFNRPGIESLANILRPTFPPGFVPAGIFDIYDQQDLDSIEAGFKWSSEDGRFIVNAAGYVSEIDNYQTFTFNAQTNGSQIIIPVDEAKLHGVEIDAAVSITDNLSTTFGFGWTDSEITVDSFRGFAGNQTPQTPDTTINAGMQYRHPINFGGGGEAFLRVDYQRIGKVFFMPANWVARDPLNLVNLRGGIEFGDGWRVEGWASNATNENYYAEGFNDGGGLFYYGKLRTWGFEVTKHF